MTSEELIEAYNGLKKIYREEGKHKYWEFDVINEAIRTLRTASNPVKVFQKRIDEQEPREHLQVFKGSYYELQLNLSRECLGYLLGC